MEVDQASVDNAIFVPDKMEPLKRMVFECFVSNKTSVQFIAGYNSLIDLGLLSQEHKAEAVIQALMEIGCSKNDCHPLLLEYLDTLWECNYFDYKQYINTLTAFRDLGKPNCILSVVNKVGLLLKKIDCDFRDESSIYILCNTFVSTLKWYSDLLSDIFSLRIESALYLTKPIINQIESFSTDNFAKYVVFCSSCIDPEPFNRLYEQACTTCEQMQEMSKSVYISKEIKETIESIPSLFKGLPTKPDFHVDYVESYRFGTQPRPAILSLVTVYSVFRVLSTNEEIANALMNIGEIMLMPKVQILVDLFRGIFLILLDYNEADEQSADQHRDLHTLILSEVWAYKRLGHILELLVESNNFSMEELSQALRKLASNSVLLNALDRRQLDNTLANILDNSRIPSILGNEEYAKIMELRMQGMKRDADLFSILYGNSNIDPAQREQRSRHFQFKNADKMAQKIRETPDETEQLMIELIDRADLIHVDLVLACLCADGKIKTFSSKLSSYVQSLEKSGVGEDGTKRNETFDSAFLLLMRIRQLFQELRLEEMTDGATISTFYKWTERYYDQLELGQPLPVNEEIKQSTFMTHFTRLKLGHAFWNTSWDFGQILEHSPAIGEALLEELSADGNKVDEESLKNIITTFDEMSCMFLCLCQWLETNPNTESLQILASVLRDVGLKFVENLATSDTANKPHLQHQINRWTLTMQLIVPTLNRLSRGPRISNITYPYLVNYARRQVRPLDPTEIPDMQVLKDSFFFAIQQGWTSPNVIVCIDRLTKNVKQVEWVQCWFRQMVNKQVNADELEIAAEICIAAAMTKPVVCLLSVIQKIIDENEFQSTSVGFNHTWILVRVADENLKCGNRGEKCTDFGFS